MSFILTFLEPTSDPNLGNEVGKLGNIRFAFPNFNKVSCKATLLISFYIMTMFLKTIEEFYFVGCMTWRKNDPG